MVAVDMLDDGRVEMLDLIWLPLICWMLDVVDMLDLIWLPLIC